MANKIAYVDSSILVAIMLSEEKAASHLKKIKRYESIISADLLVAELYATAKREQLDVEDTQNFINSVNLIFPDNSLENELKQVFACGYIRGADAYHLATAIWFMPSERKKLDFLSADQKQSQIAKALGFG